MKFKIKPFVIFVLIVLLLIAIIYLFKLSFVPCCKPVAYEGFTTADTYKLNGTTTRYNDPINSITSFVKLDCDNDKVYFNMADGQLYEQISGAIPTGATDSKPTLQTVIRSDDTSTVYVTNSKKVICITNFDDNSCINIMINSKVINYLIFVTENTVYRNEINYPKDKNLNQQTLNQFVNPKAQNRLHPDKQIFLPTKSGDGNHYIIRDFLNYDHINEEITFNVDFKTVYRSITDSEVFSNMEGFTSNIALTEGFPGPDTMNTNLAQPATVAIVDNVPINTETPATTNTPTSFPTINDANALASKAIDLSNKALDLLSSSQNVVTTVDDAEDDDDEDRGLAKHNYIMEYANGYISVFDADVADEQFQTAVETAEYLVSTNPNINYKNGLQDGLLAGTVIQSQTIEGFQEGLGETTPKGTTSSSSTTPKGTTASSSTTPKGTTASSSTTPKGTTSSSSTTPKGTTASSSTTPKGTTASSSTTPKGTTTPSSDDSPNVVKVLSTPTSENYNSVLFETRFNNEKKTGHFLILFNKITNTQNPSINNSNFVILISRADNDDGTLLDFNVYRFNKKGYVETNVVNSGTAGPSTTTGATSVTPKPGTTTGATSVTPKPGTTTGATTGTPKPGTTTGATTGTPKPATGSGPASGSGSCATTNDDYILKTELVTALFDSCPTCNGKNPNCGTCSLPQQQQKQQQDQDTYMQFLIQQYQVLGLQPPANIQRPMYPYYNNPQFPQLPQSSLQLPNIGNGLTNFLNSPLLKPGQIQSGLNSPLINPQNLPNNPALSNALNSPLLNNSNMVNSPLFNNTTTTGPVPVAGASIGTGPGTGSGSNTTSDFVPVTADFSNFGR